MSFINPITGNIPNNEFIFTETNISADNASFTNISAVNASFVNLTTTIFTPVNVNSSQISVSILNVSTGNMSVLNISTANVSDLIIDELELVNLSVDNISNDIIDTEVINIKSNNSLLPNGQLRKLNNEVILSLGDVTDVGSFSIKPDGTNTELNLTNNVLTGDTANFDTVNADNSVTDALYLNEQSVVLTDQSVIRRDANQVLFIGKSDASDVTGADFLFRTGTETGGVKLRIPRTSDIVEMIALAVDTTCNAGFGNFSEVNVSDLIVADTTTLRELEVLDSASIKNLTVVGPNGLIATKAGITNCSITNCSIGNLTAQTINGNIFTNLSAGTNIGLSQSGGVTTISTLAQVEFDDLTLDTLTMLDSVNSDPTLLSRTNNTINFIGTTNNTPLSMNFFMKNFTTTPPLLILNGTTVTAEVNGNVSVSGTIKGDISQNLASGTGINLSTVGGITTISNTGGSVTDPLNLSTLNGSVVNASTLNVSVLNPEYIEGFTKSTEYAFQATSNLNDAQTVTSGQKLDFNSVQLETPPPIIVSGNVAYGYDTTLKQYIVPESGRYLFGFKLFSPTTTVYTIRVGIYVNGVVKGFGGEYTYTNEAITCILDVEKGQWIDVRCYSGTALFYMAPLHSWFYGHKLTPANNQIVSTTNLSIQNLSVTDDMTATNISTTNISATTMTFDTASGDKAITTIGEIDAVKFNASSVYISNDISIDPGGNIRVQSLVPGNDFYIYTNSGNTFLGNLGTGNLNIGNGYIADDISISPTGVLTVDNLTSTNAITAPSATITNISSTDLTIATSLTGAGNINITGSIQTTGILSGTTLTGDLSGNLSAGTGIVLSTAAGVTNISNSAPYQLPVSRIFAARTTGLQQPNQSGNNYYTDYDLIDQTSSHVTYVAVPISTGGANTGAIIQTAGTYKITFTQHVYNNSFTNRVSWWSRATKNNTPTGAQTFIYTRSDQSQYAQYGSNSITWIETCAVNDYLQVWSVVAKNSPLYNNNWDGLRGGSGSMIVIELLT